MDLLEQAAGVWRRRVVVLLVALVVAAAVLVWRSAAPETFTASTTVQVRLPTSATGDPAVQVPYYALSVSGLAESREVIAGALDRSGRTGEDVDDVAADVSTTIDSSTGFVTVTASGASGADAAALADAMAEVLGEEIANDQADDLTAQRTALTNSIAALAEERRDTNAGDKFALAALEREREALLGSLRSLADQVPWRLAVTSPAEVPDAPDAPKPLRDALLAFIIALLVAAEGVVLLRAVRGSLSARDPGGDAAETAGVPAVVIGASDGPTVLAPLLPEVEPGRSVTVVQRGRTAGARSATMLSRLLAARGDDVLLVDASPEHPTVHAEVGVALSPGLTEITGLGKGDQVFEGLPDAAGVRVLAAGPPQPGNQAGRITHVLKSAPQGRIVVAARSDVVDDLLPISAALDGPTVLEIDTDTTRKQLRAEVTALRGLGLEVVAVTVVGRPSWRARISGRGTASA